MALRTILRDTEPALKKISREVTDFNERLWTLLDDLTQTMRNAEGVGLAAPQVGILRRVFVMDVGDGVVEVINPEILEERGTQETQEGCLSSPGKYGITRRPQYVRIKAQDRHGKRIVITGEDLKAKCLCHEIDHLNGILFMSHVI